jgi:Na+-translocating ferredoxin:NAD+ oxidoreductase subunit B
MIFELVTAGLVMAGLGLTLSVVLAVANRKLHVFEDPRIDAIEDMLPKANCGACGLAGCRAFAEQVVAGEVKPSKCTASGADTVAAIAEYLGVDAGSEEKRVARLACAGGRHVAWHRARYQGMQSCRAASLVAGGGKGCVWGCLGLGDCKEVCDFGAITLNEHGLPVVDADLCTACGACVDICPRGLYSIHPVSHRLWVACTSKAKGDTAAAECEVACTACGRCAMDAPEGLITMADNLPVVDYSRNDLASPHAIQRCPTGAIVWFDDEGEMQKGEAARKVLRRTSLPIR